MYRQWMTEPHSTVPIYEGINNTDITHWAKPHQIARDDWKIRKWGHSMMSHNLHLRRAEDAELFRKECSGWVAPDHEWAWEKVNAAMADE